MIDRVWAPEWSHPAGDVLTTHPLFLFGGKMRRHFSAGQTHWQLTAREQKARLLLAKSGPVIERAVLSGARRPRERLCHPCETLRPLAHTLSMPLGFGWVDRGEGT